MKSPSGQDSSGAVIEVLPNGLTVIVEEMPHVRSAAYSLHLPCGIVFDRADRVGQSLVLGELISRGAGGYNSRELSDMFDRLGARHSEGAGLTSTSLAGSLLAENLPAALDLVSLMVREPTLPEEQILSIKSLLLQEISSLRDNPMKRVVVELRKRYFPDPYGRSSVGEEAGLSDTDLNDLRSQFRETFSPHGSVLSIAGRISTSQIMPQIKQIFGNWSGGKSKKPPFGSLQPLSSNHLQEDGAQLQIALAYPSERFLGPKYYDARLASELLSGGMFGRLFIEVREKRGLCYSVWASFSATDQNGAVFAYAGTTPERAQETLDVLVQQLRALRGTVTDQELGRAKANLKASLIMAEESSGSRAGSNATDWWWSGRVRSLAEIEAGIDAVSCSTIDSYLDVYPPDKMALLTLGSRRLELR